MEPHENHTLEYMGKILIDNYPIVYYNITKGSAELVWTEQIMNTIDILFKMRKKI